MHVPTGCRLPIASRLEHALPGSRISLGGVQSWGCAPRSGAVASFIIWAVSKVVVALRAFVMAKMLDPSYCCRLCQARPFARVREGEGPNGPEWGSRSCDPGTDDGSLLDFITPDFCRNCDDVLDCCYLLDQLPGHRLQHCQGKLDLIQAIEASHEMLAEFIERKVTYNGVLLEAARAKRNVLDRGKKVFLQTLTRTREHANMYDWWPRQVYMDKYGDPETNKFGHTRMKHNGKDGVAIFHAPAGVIRVIPETVTVAGQVTILATTAAGLEFFTGEVEASWREACKGFEQQTSQIESARKLTKSPETFSSDAYAQTLAGRVSSQVGTQVKQWSSTRGEGGTVDDHVSVVTGVWGRTG